MKIPTNFITGGMVKMLTTQQNSGNVVTDVTLPFKYGKLDSDGKVYAKVDWVTIMFGDCSMNDVLKWLHLDHCVDSFLEACFQQCRGYDDVVKFVYNGITLETGSLSFYGMGYDINCFDVIVPKLRLEISGTGLDYLRSIGIDFNEYRLSEPILPDGASFHYTRIDFAYDFINYKPEFIDKLIDHINTHKLPSERVPLASSNGAISVKIVLGGQKTVYLGSSQSDRMLRCYDKRMQFVDLSTGVYKKENPYQDPDSWFRIEWQTRNLFANALAHGTDENGVPADFKSILKEIFHRYAFADGTVDNTHAQRPVVDFWLTLFNWEDLKHRIIQNAKYVELQDYRTRIVTAYEKRDWKRQAIVESIKGRAYCVQVIQENLDEIQKPHNSRRFQLLLNQINEVGIRCPSDPDPDYVGFYNNCGRLAYKG